MNKIHNAHAVAIRAVLREMVHSFSREHSKGAHPDDESNRSRQDRVIYKKVKRVAPTDTSRKDFTNVLCLLHQMLEVPMRTY